MQYRISDVFASVLAPRIEFGSGFCRTVCEWVSTELCDAVGFEDANTAHHVPNIHGRDVPKPARIRSNVRRVARNVEGRRIGANVRAAQGEQSDAYQHFAVRGQPNRADRERVLGRMTFTRHSGADFEANRTGRRRGEQLPGVDVVDAREPEPGRAGSSGSAVSV